ncbi:hypothetical protein KHQ81_15480 (plasmid) [Mycoplasmatota bacterium]|nr:hypothetical protein KHQ81_15480 [Mycoplasmatota bacterium]
MEWLEKCLEDKRGVKMNKRYIIPKRLTKNNEVFDGITRADLFSATIGIIIGIIILISLRNLGLPVLVWFIIGGFVISISVMLVIPLGDGTNLRRQLKKIRKFFRIQQRFRYIYQSNYENLNTFKKALDFRKIQEEGEE